MTNGYLSRGIMATQLPLPIGRPKQPILNLTGMVYNILADGGWWTPAEIVRTLHQRHGEWHSDSSITARLRDLRKERFGGHTVEKRIREGCKSYEYHLGDSL